MPQSWRGPAEKSAAVAKDMSLSGALLGRADLPRDSLPLSDFTLVVEFTEIRELSGLALVSRLARFANPVAGRLELGVACVGMGSGDQARLE